MFCHRYFAKGGVKEMEVEHTALSYMGRGSAENLSGGKTVTKESEGE